MTKNIKMELLILAVAVFLFTSLNTVSGAGRMTLKKGQSFPSIEFIAPPDEASLKYLDVTGSKPFTLSDIKADLVLVEVMNVYCHTCQTKAPFNNKLYEQIVSDPILKNRVKMFSVAVGSMDAQIKMFKKEYNTPYPILEDPKFAVYDAIGFGSVPQTLYLQKNNKKGIWTISEIKLGIIPDHTEIVGNIRNLLGADISVAANSEKKSSKVSAETVVPLLCGKALSDKIKTIFMEQGESVKEYKTIALSNGETVHTALVQKSGNDERLFAVNISRSVPCDVCHDIHFIYLFDISGKVLQLIPLALSKYDNEEWDDEDIAVIRGRIVGRYLYHSFDFDPDVDAVSSATISSSMIFKSLNEGKYIFNDLKQKGSL